jgi:hypothetical protein
MFFDEMNDEWEEFLARRIEGLPVLPKIEHHGHGHHAGPIDKDHLRKINTTITLY